MDEKKAKRFVSFLKNKYGEEGAKKKIQKIQKTGKVDDEDLKEFQASEQKQQQTQAKKALHGAKLNYFKSLKHQCAEDEEVVYYKKGGSVGCGCKKKMEEGGQTPKNKNNAIDKFKNRKQDQASRDSLRINSIKGDDELEAVRPGSYKPNPKHNPKDPNSRTHIWVPDRTKEPYNKDKKAVKKGANGTYVDVPMWAMDPASKWQKQDYLKSNGVNPNTWKGTKAFTDAPSLKKGDKVKKNKKDSAVDKFKSAKCGSKMKKHYFGGSLNRIPFFKMGK